MHTTATTTTIAIKALRAILFTSRLVAWFREKMFEMANEFVRLSRAQVVGVDGLEFAFDGAGLRWGCLSEEIHLLR